MNNEGSALDAIARMSWKPVEQLIEESKLPEHTTTRKTEIEPSNIIEKVDEVIDTYSKRFTFEQPPFRSYDLELDSNNHVNVVKFHLQNRGSFKLYISAYDLGNENIPAQKWVTQEQQITSIKKIYLWNIQQKAWSWYKWLKHLNYYRKFAWNPWQLSGFVKTLLFNYHNQKLA